MSLKLIYGGAGTGKSTYCIEQIKKRLDDNKNNLILIVPEQLSFQGEKNLIKEIGGVGVNGVRVLSFKRLAYTVFKECGGITRRHMDTSGRSMLLFKVIEELKEELSVFAIAAKQSGFIDTLSKIISEFKRHNVTTEIINEAKVKVGENSLLYNKLNDLSKVYEKFEEYLHTDYIDSDDDLTLLASKMDQCTIFNGAHIWIDEFNGFTPQQYTVIEKLMKKSAKLNITLNVPYNSSHVKNSEVFQSVLYMENKLIMLAQQNGIAIEQPIDLKYSKKFQNPELEHLEKNYFAYPFKKYEEEVKNLQIFKAQNSYDEVQNVAGEILRLCREEGARYNEIAVVSRELEAYESEVKSIFKEYNIPFFLDAKKDIISNPLIVLLISSIEIFNKKWSYESVFRYLKTGLLPLDLKDIDLLENYILMKGIKGKSSWDNDEKWFNNLIETYDLKEKYKKALDISIEKELITLDEIKGCIYKGGITYAEKKAIGLELSEEDKELLEDMAINTLEEDHTLDDFNDAIMEVKSINKVRDLLVKTIIPFHDSIKGKKLCSDICLGIYDFLVNTNMPEKIENLMKEFFELGQLEMVNEYSQIWNILIGILDQLVEVLGKEKLNLEEFSKVLVTGLSQHQIGFIPPSLDQVMITSVERIKSHETKYLFLIGVNDGVFPTGSYTEGILTDLDRIALSDAGVELAKNTKALAFEEQFLIYKTLTIPSGCLRVSYPISNFEGKTMRPSIIISRLKSIFPKLIEKSNIVEENIEHKIVSPTPTFNNLIIALRDSAEAKHLEAIWKYTYDWYAVRDGYEEKINNLIEAFKYNNIIENLNEKSVKNLYSKDNRFSVSKIEKYEECPFAYFIQYGLKAKERKLFELTPPDLGTFMHKVIDGFSKNVSSSGMDWNNLDNKWCEDTIKEMIDKTIEEPYGKIFMSTPKYKYYGERIKRVLNKSALTIVEQIKIGEFKPVGYEIEFGGEEYPPIELKLENGEIIKLVGKIDRVDKLVMDDGEYFRIIDYKSGKKDLKLFDVYTGLQLQLLTYLDAMLTNESMDGKLPVFPAGVLYFTLDDPLAKTRARVSSEELEKLILKELRMKGLVLNDTRVIVKMDKTIDGVSGASIVIPASMKKDGELSLAKSNVATKEQFECLRSHVREKLKEACNNMLKGIIDIKPYKSSTRTACEYCDYESICAFDPLLKENSYRRINSLKDNEVWEKLEKECGGEHKCQK